MSDLSKPTPEAFQFMVRYSDVAKVKIDLNDVAKVMGTKYKAAWDGFNKAKKDLAAAGYVAPVSATDDSAGSKGDGGAANLPNKKKKNGAEKSKDVNDKTSKVKTTGEPMKKRKAAAMNDDGSNDEEGDEGNKVSPKSEKKVRGRPTKAAKREKSEEVETETVANGVSNELSEIDSGASATKEEEEVEEEEE